jgi:hypothetical protein
MYYLWNGPSHADPFRSELQPESIKDALDRFPIALRHSLPDIDAMVTSTSIEDDSNAINVVIETSLDDTIVAKAIVKCLHDEKLDLFGEKK